jgi:hypothetical protein
MKLVTAGFIASLHGDVKMATTESHLWRSPLTMQLQRRDRVVEGLKQIIDARECYCQQRPTSPPFTKITI